MSEPQKKPRLITAVRFVNSVQFGTTEATFITMGAGKCDRVFAARIEADGTAVAIDKGQRADGLLFERDRTDTNTRTAITDRAFTPWVNISGINY